MSASRGGLHFEPTVVFVIVLLLLLRRLAVIETCAETLHTDADQDTSPGGVYLFIVGRRIYLLPQVGCADNVSDAESESFADLVFLLTVNREYVPLETSVVISYIAAISPVA